MFDIIVLSILLASAGIGFWKGAAHEMVAVLSFLIAAVVAVYGLRLTGPIGRNLVDPDWLGTVAGMVVTFALVYGGLRLAGGSLANQLQQSQLLGLMDRTVGLGFGLIRAFVLLGAFNLAFTAATPPSLMPKWLTDATFYPMTTAAGTVLKTFAPKGWNMAGKLTPAIADAVRDGSANSPRDSEGGRGYDARDRGEIDDLVEKSR
jgi:membrane protein required for colicin V production